jgi:hypothetical protein
MKSTLLQNTTSMARTATAALRDVETTCACANFHGTLLFATRPSLLLQADPAVHAHFFNRTLISPLHDAMQIWDLQSILQGKSGPIGLRLKNTVLKQELV